MTQVISPAQQATGRIKLALARLAFRYPFHAKVLEQFRVQAAPGLATMAVAVIGKKLLLLHCPEFVLDTPADQLVGVLLHETHHVVLGHVYTKPADYPDKWARTIAQEVTVNEFVKEPLPAGVITLDQFPMLPPLESTAERYRRLRKIRRRVPISPPISTPADSVGSAAGGQVDPSTHTKPTAGKVPPEGTKHTLDDHRYWAEALKDAQAAREAIRDALLQAVLEVGTDGLPEALRAALRGLGAGVVPGEQQYQLRGDRTGKLDWRHLLRRYVGELLEPQPALHRPPRRFPELAGIVPARSRRPAKPHVMAVIDTSGSISDELLELIDGELRRLATNHEVTVVECDAMIHKVAKYRGLEAVTGRGGTDFCPPLEPDFLRKHRADVVIYFTDGEGPAPEQAPQIPVIWCLVPRGKAPAPWGKMIRMGTEGPE